MFVPVSCCDMVQELLGNFCCQVCDCRLQKAFLSECQILKQAAAYSYKKTELTRSRLPIMTHLGLSAAPVLAMFAVACQGPIGNV